MLPRFLEVAKNPTASPEAASTVYRLKQFAASWDEDADKLTDEEAFERLSKKDWISLQGNVSGRNGKAQILDLSPLTDFSSLTGLCVSGNRIQSIAPVASLHRLRRLSLDSNEIHDLSPLVGLPELSVLDIQNNPVQDLAPLARIPGLRELEVSATQCRSSADVTNRVSLPQLWRLHIHGSCQDLRQLPDCPSLRSIRVSGCDSLEGIQRYAELRNLDCPNGKVKDLAPLATLQRLTHLSLCSHRVKSLAPLAHLYALRDVTLLNNRITSVAPLDGLPVLRQANLSGNPIPGGQLQRLIASLTPWDIEFLNDGLERPYGPEIVEVDQQTWNYYDEHPFGLEAYDGDVELLANEKLWLQKRIEAALSIDWQADEDFAIPWHSPQRRSFTVCMYSPEMIDRTRAVINVIQHALAEMRKDFIVYLQTDCLASEAPEFAVWIYRQKLLTTPETSDVIGKLMSF